MSFLDFSVIMIQIVLPLFLIGWLTVAPAKSAIGYGLQIVSTGLSILAIALISLWMMPPWWTPYLYAAAASVTVIGQVVKHRGSFDCILPLSWRGWVAAFALLILWRLCQFPNRHGA